MPVFWYYCEQCGSKFSWVFTGINDCVHCVKCRSNKIVRIKNSNYRR